MVSFKDLFIRLFCAGTCILAVCTQSFAQPAPADSVIFDSISVTAGQPAVLTARLNNTQSLISLYIPLIYPVAELTLDSVSWVNSRPDLQGIGAYTVDTDAGHILVGLTALYEPYIVPGRGVLAQFYFSTAADAADGSVAVVDTSFLPPNQPLYARNIDMDDAVPFFAPGLVEINEINYAPTIQVDASHFVSEGETLEFMVTVSDPNDDPLTVSMAGAPSTATFSDQGGGLHQFTWTPDYIGPFSAAASPLSVTFHATDGELPRNKTVQLWVGNVNRPPEFVTPTVTPTNARDTVRFAIEALDPDLEPLTIICLSEIQDYAILGANPWTFVWGTTNADVGQTTLRFVCQDEYAATDTIDVTITVVEFPAFSLRIADLEEFSGQPVTVDILLRTEDSIGAADLLIKFDPGAMIFAGVERAGCGLESWEFFSAAEVNGIGGTSVHIVGIAEMDNGIPSSPLPPSDTVLFRLQFLLSAQIQYHDQSIPLSFNMAAITDNLLSDPQGTLIPREEIEFVAGSVLIKMPTHFLIGDINLNGLAFEVGDAVRFTNYFIYGQQAALDFTQRANADCNLDGIPATVADLVYLIRKIVED